MVRTKADVMEWVDAQLVQDARLRDAVEARLAELRLEQQLVALRQARGLSQGQAARLIGVSQPAIARLESGPVRNVELKTLLRVVTALGGRLNLSIERPTTRAVGGRSAARRAAAKL
jgi:transcriptional regulator with XRE-family HTH domain